MHKKQQWPNLQY